MIQGVGLENNGLCYPISDIQGKQPVIGSYGLLLMGLCFNKSEIWATAFAKVNSSWTKLSLPTTTWTRVSTPITTWTKI